MRKTSFLHHVSVGVTALFLGLGGAYGISKILGSTTGATALGQTSFLEPAGERIVPGKFMPVRFNPPGQGKMIGVDLRQRQVVLFHDGKVSSTFSLLAMGAEGSPWQTLPGNYKVLKKEHEHRSPIALATMPWSVQFFGNSFFHAPIVKKEATKKQKGAVDVPLGSLTLAPLDAEQLYRFASVGTPVAVIGDPSEARTAHLALATLGGVGLHFEKLPMKPPQVSARSYLVVDLSTNSTLLEKDAELQLPIASVTKLMTTVVARETLQASTTITVSRRAAQTFGAAGALAEGEKIALAETYYPLLLESSNKAAEVIAEGGGDRVAFLAAMNAKAKALGMGQTHYDDPSGLDPHNVSSARDLVRLASYVQDKHQSVLQLTLLPSYQTATGAHSWYNHNRLVVGNNKYYIGGKTGYIPEAGQTSVALFSFPAGEFVEKKVAVVLLRSYNRDQDTRNILRYLQQGLFYDTGVPVNDDDLSLSRFSMKRATTTEAMSVVTVGNIRLDRLQLGKALSESYFLNTASVALGNLLGPITSVGYKSTTDEAVKTPETAPAELVRSGFDALMIGNEHAGDWGRSGFSQTISALRKHGINALGAGEDAADAARAAIYEAEGVRVGLLGVSADAPLWLHTPENLSVVLSHRDPTLLQTVRMEAARVHHLLVSVSYSASTTNLATFQELARSIIDAGAHVVVGVGPHSPGPVEKYHEGVIAYSLGDFLYPSKEMTQGLAMEFIFEKAKIAAVNAEQVALDDEDKLVLVSQEE